MFKCLGPAHIGLQLPWPELHDLAARHGFQCVELTTGGVRAGGFSLPMRFDRHEAEYASDELDLDANLEFHAERVRSVAETLLLSGIRFGIEFIGMPSLRRPNRHEFIHTLPGPLALGARIGTPNVGFLMDTWHLFTVLDEVGFDGPTLVEPFNAEVRALPPEERVAAVAASLESVWP